MNTVEAQAEVIPAEAFYAEDHVLPWEGLNVPSIQAQIKPGTKTAEAALEQAGLNWLVAMDAVYAGPDKRLVPEHQSVVRLSDGHIISVVGSKYEPVQNLQVFEFMDELIGKGELDIQNAGQLYNGKKVWIQAILKGGRSVGGDAYQDYLVGVNSHDGTATAKWFETSVRLFCGNQLRRALRGAEKVLRIYHRGDVEGRIDATFAFLGIVQREREALYAWLRKMQEVKVDRYKAFATLREELFGVAAGSKDEDTPAQRREAVELFKKIYYSEQEYMGGKFKDTAYPIVQAITGYADHAGLTRTRPEGNERMFTFFMRGQQFKQRGMDLVAKMTKIPSALS